MPWPARDKARERFKNNRKILLVSFSLAVAALALLTASHLRAGAIWWADVVTLFQPALLIASAAALAFSPLTKSRALILASGVVLALNLAIIAQPALKRRPSAGAAGQPLVVTTFNLAFDNTEFEKVETWVRATSPDLLGVQEVTPPWATLLDKLGDTYPYSARLVAKRSWSTVNLISRYPIKSADFAIIGEEQMALTATLDVNGQAVLVSVLHPPSLRTRYQWMGRNRYLQAAAASMNGDAAPRKGAPSIVMGDFNASRWSPHFGRFIATAGLGDADHDWIPKPTRVLARPGGWPLGSPIDHILISPTVRSLGCRPGPYLGSDHVPLTCTLRLPAR